MESVRDSKIPVFENGLAQPVFPFTDGKTGAAYDPAMSHIVRYCAYVESDYDMDGDGRRDRIKIVVQVPRSAAEGHYKAGTILEACPYFAGVHVDCFDHMKQVQDLALPDPDFSLMRDAAPEIPSGEMTSLEAAATADPADWYYPDAGNKGAFCYDIDFYNYYLIRGFAAVYCAGFGTLGSDGIEYTGSHYERDAFRAVVEWLHGDRVAYTDRRGTTAIKADWSNGCVAMTGKSYAGTLPFAVAVTGVPGLRTIIPVAGIADWYSNLNQQGAQRYYPREMLVSFLAYFCTSRYLDPTLTEEQRRRLDASLSRLSAEQLSSGFDYGEFWEERNYTREADKIRCTALIVHGLNDENVSTKHFEMMLHSFKKAGMEAKLLLHQGGHITPTMQNRGYGILVDGQNYDDILNRWISHFLYDVDNGAELMPEVLVQSNLDQDRWERADAWETCKTAFLRCASDGVSVVDTDWEKAGVNAENFDEKMSLASGSMNRRYLSAPLGEELTIQGTVKVCFSAALADGDANENFHAVNANDADKKTLALGNASGRQDDLKLTVLLVDLAQEDFESISTTDPIRDDVPMKVVQAGGLPLGGELPPLDVRAFEPVSRPYKVISRAYLDLCNPEAGYEPESAAAWVTLKMGEFHNYTACLNPTRYTIAAGHRLAVVIGTEDPVNCLLHKEYAASVENSSVSAELPVLEDVPEKMTITAE